jgi:aminoglycoside phosphotransferase (APT) family kinase protein
MPRMHEGEFETSIALVQELTLVQFPEWANLPITPVKSVGTDNALYRLGEKMVVRLPHVE